MLTFSQKEVLNIVLAGHNVFIGGSAGTGKSHVVEAIVRNLRNIGKRVSLTCTTGIACTNFPSELKPCTIHRWSGIEDGRYSTSEILSIIKSNPKYTDTFERIKGTDVLIIDEISMLSKKMFEQVAEICSLKDDRKVFGGIQIVLCGDFFQLPPVPNTLYDDEGEFCFKSSVFTNDIPHKHILTEVIRQRNETLIKVINDVSRGIESDESVVFIKALERPLPEEDSQLPSVKLFSSNYLVDNFNRKELLNLNGEIYEYSSEDTGEEKHLKSILAPKKLLLKNSSSVMLLRNLSDTLCNGLVGKVTALDHDGPTVYFETIKKTIKMSRIKFTVFSPRLRKCVATREQFPLKLAFAMTIHKAQGMTLDKVEIDCRQIFKAGQLGVALGRVRSETGLRVINFQPEHCIPQPDRLLEFEQKTSLPFNDTLSCCKHLRHVALEEHEYTLEEIEEIDRLCSVDVTPPELWGDDLMDEELLDIELNDISTHHDVHEAEELNLIPTDFDLKSVLSEMHQEELLTPVQAETNKAVIVLKERFVKNVQRFCNREFSVLGEAMTDLGCNEPNPEPVKASKLASFYTKCQQHQTSAQTKANIMFMFQDFPEPVDVTVMSMIAYKLHVHVRTYLLKDREKQYITPGKDTNQRFITESSRGKVRYVGGYCVAKLRHKYIKSQMTKQYKIGPLDQLEHEEATSMVKILDHFRVNESSLQRTSAHVETLLETSKRQNVTRGLVSIPDSVYNFFIRVCEECLKLLIEKNMNLYGHQLFQHCSSALLESKEVFGDFVNIIATINMQDLSNDSSVSGVLNEMLDIISVVERVYKEMINKFLLVLLNQFRKDFLQALCVEKKMAHRKQIQLKTSKAKTQMPKVDYQFILSDKSDRKSVSHHFLKGLVSENPDHLSCMKRSQLLILAKAYHADTLSKDVKKNIVLKINAKILAASDTDHALGSIEDMSTPSAGPSGTRVTATPSAGPSGTRVTATPSAEPSGTRVTATPSAEPSGTRVTATPSAEPSGTRVTATPSAEPSGTRVAATPRAGPSGTRVTAEIPVACPSMETLSPEPSSGMSTMDTSANMFSESQICKICECLIKKECIYCHGCQCWFHRKCAGLSNHLKWKKVNKKNTKFFCYECE